MSRSRKESRRRRRFKVGAPPGVLVPDPQAEAPLVSVIAYGPDAREELRPADPGQVIKQIKALKGRYPVLWVDVSGLRDLELVSALGALFGLHDLALEDVVNVHQRAKVEAYEDNLFLVTRMLRAGERIETEQVSLFLGKDFVLTFQEKPGDCFDALRERLRRSKSRIAAQGADYLTYALLDSVIDSYFPVLEMRGETLEELEEAVVGEPDGALVEEIHRLRRDLLALRRAVWPQREMVNALLRDECALVSAQTRIYLRDCYDHVVQLMDIIETSREVAADLMDLYLSSSSQRLNEVMKVLTVIATIFMPLSFIASLYGMNFDRASPWNMPELSWRFGYFYALALMLGSLGLMLLYFWRKRWIRFGFSRKRRR